MRRPPATLHEAHRPTIQTGDEPCPPIAAGRRAGAGLPLVVSLGCRLVKPLSERGRRIGQRCEPQLAQQRPLVRPQSLDRDAQSPSAAGD